MEEKDVLRTLAFKKRDNLENRDSLEHQINKNIESSINKNQIIAAYYPIKGEVNILPLLDKKIDEGYKISLPVINGDRLIFKEYMGQDNLEMGSFGIKVPNEDSKIVNPDTFLVPALAFDNKRYRLGYGGGYYDRIFFKLESFIAIGIGFSCQVLDELPIEEHDIKMNKIITEDGEV